jgi:ribonuclease PH
MRADKRKNHEMRSLEIVPDYVKNVPGSVLIEQGHTRIISTATYENRVPHFLKESSKGWIVSEYSMLPGSTGKQRLNRERNKSNSRNIEIQRFIGRAFRNTLDLNQISGKTIYIDCDVIQADGSTRCVSINGGMIALIKSLKYLVFENLIADLPAIEVIAAVSIGIKGSDILIDLTYEEDASVDADINLVSSEKNNIIEIQAFAEEAPISNTVFKKAIDLGIKKNLETIRVLKEYI